MSLTRTLFKLKQEKNEYVDPKKVDWANEYIKMIQLPAFKALIDQLKDQAMNEGLDISTHDQALIAVGKRQKLIELLAKFENDKKIAIQLLKIDSDE